MWNKPSDATLAKLPRPYSGESTPLEEKIVHAHFFIGGCDWWATEWDPESREFFGYVNLNSPQDAEWGYFSLDEIAAIKIRGMEVDFDLHWRPTAVKDISRIQLVKAGR